LYLNYKQHVLSGKITLISFSDIKSEGHRQRERPKVRDKGKITG